MYICIGPFCFNSCNSPSSHDILPWLLFVRGLLYYLRYFCLFTSSGVQHILCGVFVLFVFLLCTLCCQFLWIVFVLFVFLLCTLCCQFLWIVHFILSLRNPLTFISRLIKWTLSVLYKFSKIFKTVRRFNGNNTKVGIQWETIDTS